MRRVIASMIATTVMVCAVPAAAGAAQPSTVPADARSVTLFFIGDGDDLHDAVARVRGRSVIGWTGLRDSDAVSCFRGRVVGGKFVGKQFLESPESGEWFVGPTIVRARGVGDGFRVTGMRYFDSLTQSWKVDRSLRKASAARVDAVLGPGGADMLRTFVDRCVQMWKDNT